MLTQLEILNFSLRKIGTTRKSTSFYVTLKIIQSEVWHEIEEQVNWQLYTLKVVQIIKQVNTGSLNFILIPFCTFPMPATKPLSWEWNFAIMADMVTFTTNIVLIKVTIDVLITMVSDFHQGFSLTSPKLHFTSHINLLYIIWLNFCY